MRCNKKQSVRWPPLQGMNAVELNARKICGAVSGQKDVHDEKKGPILRHSGVRDGVVVRT